MGIEGGEVTFSGPDLLSLYSRRRGIKHYETCWMISTEHLSHQRPSPTSATKVFHPGKINLRYSICAVRGVKPLVCSVSEVILVFVAMLIAPTHSLTADAGHCTCSGFHGACTLAACNENALHSHVDLVSARKLVNSRS